MANMDLYGLNDKKNWLETLKLPIKWKKKYFTLIE